MIDYAVIFFKSFFENPSAWGIGLAILFGAVWLAGYRPPIFKRPWIWAVLVSSAFLTLAAVSFVQIPLQTWTGQALNHFWSQEVLLRWILLAGIPQILLSGLVQEGSKLVPVVVYWQGSSSSRWILGTGWILGKVLCRSLSYSLFRHGRVWSGSRMGMAVLPHSLCSARLTEL